jgi:hypothetical protein
LSPGNGRIGFEPTIGFGFGSGMPPDHLSARSVTHAAISAVRRKTEARNHQVSGSREGETAEERVGDGRSRNEETDSRPHGVECITLEILRPDRFVVDDAVRLLPILGGRLSALNRRRGDLRRG